MKVVLIDSEKLTQINLPTEIEGVFVNNYKYPNTKFERSVNIEAKDNQWILKNNGSINIDSDEEIDEIILSNYKFFELKIIDTEFKIGCFCMPSIEENQTKLTITPKEEYYQIGIGSSQDCYIRYNTPLITERYANLQYKKGNWYIVSEDPKNYVFLNNRKVQEEILKIGDIIFIYGLKIIWMNSFIQINNPKDTVIINGIALEEYTEEKTDNSEYSPISEEMQNIALYKDEDYFFHTPRLMQSVKEEEITIDDPPENQDVEDMPFIFSIGSSLTMVASSMVSTISISSGLANGTKTLQSAIPTIIMTVALIIGSLLMPRFAKAYTNKKKKAREALRQTKYTQYVEKKEKEIKIILSKQAQILNENYRPAQECINLINGSKKLIWSRIITDEDFLTLRLGKGNRPTKLKIHAPEDKFTLDEDNLREKVFELVKNNQELKDVPITISLLEDRITALICEPSVEKKYTENLLIQLMTHHSSLDLKIVFLLNGSDKTKYDYAKFMPHTFSEDKTVRFYATNIEEMKSISKFLEEEYTNRKAKSQAKNKNKDENKDDKKPYLNFESYYLIITDSFSQSKTIGIVDTIINDQRNYGFSLLILDHFLQNLPNQCNTFINIINKEGALVRRDLNSQLLFTPELLENSDMRDLSTKLLNIPTITAEALKSLPTSLTFLEMFNASKIEQLNILNRWKSNDPTISLQTPIGVHTNGETFNLDLHEKFHGPHGLVAGSTGSGKSEFIITYILSMAVNYHPDYVQFVLIDYKGGGLAGAFENRETGVRSPHLAGTITNLDKSEMNRTLVSINSELKRRQRLFNEARDTLEESTIDIYKYQKYYREGQIKEAIPHLFIVSDEFAELKSQQPEFMDELISTARIGRSLGVHLILATQKPTGVVNEQIWSNSKFKVCLKVQSPSDSMELLKKPDAASIKEVGRFYLQVGYDEYFDIGQSGWGGAKYVPSDRVIKKVDDSINFINNIGYVVKSTNDTIKKDESIELGDQLTNIVKYLEELGKKENVKRHQLWLDNIPEEIYIDDIIKKYNYSPTPYNLNPVIGELDDPVGQRQDCLTLNLSEKGNTIIWGMAGSGKENFLYTLIYSLATSHSPEEVNIYLLDYGSESLRIFNKFPHVGDICYLNESDKIMNLLILLDDEMDRRKELFAEYNGNIETYNQQSGNKEKYYVVCINNYEGFAEGNPKIAEMIIPFYREGIKFGIYFVCTLNTTTSIRSRTQDYFQNKISLQMSNPMDYRTLVNAPKTLLPSKMFGRGLIKGDDTTYEFQTALIGKQDTMNDIIKRTATELKEKYQTNANRIPIIPEVVTKELLFNDVKTINNVPIGINIETKYSLLFDFMKSNTTTILSQSLNNITSFTYGLLNILRIIPNVTYKVIDVINLINSDKIGIEFEYDSSEFNNSINKIINDINNQATIQNPIFYIIIGLSELKKKLSPEYKKPLDTIFENTNKIKNIKFILIESYDTFKKLQIENWYDKIDKQNGIWLGDGVDTQMALSFDNISIEDKQTKFADSAFVTNKGPRYIMKSVSNKDGE